MTEHGSTHNSRDRKLLAVVALVALAVLVLPVMASTLDPLDGPGDAPAGQQNGLKAVALGNLTANGGFKTKTIVQGTTLVLNGSQSIHEKNITDYTWTIYRNQSGIRTLIVTLHGEQVSHQFLQYGEYAIDLTIKDTDNDTATTTMNLRVSEDAVKPRAEAGSPKIVAPGQSRVVTLDGSGSTDRVGVILNYTWYFMLRNETEVWLYGEEVNYTFAKTGTYVVLLNVTDGGGNYNTDTVDVVIQGQPSPIAKYWFWIFVVAPIVLAVIWIVVSRLMRGTGFITPTDVEKARLQWKGFKKNWRVFKENKLGYAGLIVLIIFVVIAAIAPILTTDLTGIHNPQNDVEPNQPGDPNTTADDWFNPLPPSLTPSPWTGYRHPFGTDIAGRDVYTLTMYGTRASLEVGLVATFISVVLGALIGLASGYFGRVTDEALMRLTDFFLVLPWFPLMIVMMAILGQKFIWVVVVIGVTSWPSTARVVRSQVLTVKERQFIVRAKAIGAGDSHIIRTHILPNVLPLVFANTVLLIAIAIFSEAFLDFFGLGDPTVISWGSMLEAAYDGQAFGTGAWWWIAAPGAAIVIMVLAFSLVGYAIDDVLNPKLRKR